MSVKYEHDCPVLPPKVPADTVDHYKAVEWTWRCPNCKQRWLLKRNVGAYSTQVSARRVELIDTIPMMNVIVYAVGGTLGVAALIGIIVELLTSH